LAGGRSSVLLAQEEWNLTGSTGALWKLDPLGFVGALDLFGDWNNNILSWNIKELNESGGWGWIWSVISWASRSSG